ncbi:hypothetical protein LMG28688_06692 [Paraburkholderia caffeinitolerans]|uniref:Uncharacterized protein n=1 Tax=Paraburkholderia caffeinitolerans TaxID=1723730 RepID=A0A6J5GWA0_9BURK|nr:hypothetical protein [Paraburkholderia caffeinitolerans]CAB3808118.1 hypothetical protein LMG28688_06692 [Paraburkholderia caffeinitolerans]
MRDLYTSHAAALRNALRHTVERGGQSSLAVLHQGVPSAYTLTGGRRDRAGLRAAYAQVSTLYSRSACRTSPAALPSGAVFKPVRIFADVAIAGASVSPGPTHLANVLHPQQ